MRWKGIPKNTVAVVIETRTEIPLAVANRFNSAVSDFTMGNGWVNFPDLDTTIVFMEVRFRKPLTKEEAASFASFVHGFFAGLGYEGGWSWEWFVKGVGWMPSKAKTNPYYAT